MPDPVGITPFRQFVDSLGDIRPEQHVGVAARGARSAADVTRMRDYLVQYYDGMEAPHSYVDDNNSVFDFVPIQQQPALRGSRPATPTDLPSPAPGSAATAADQLRARHVIQLHPYFRDRFGNQMSAPDGTIPVRRLTVENLARFATLENFFQKSP